MFVMKSFKNYEETGFGLAEIIALCSAAISIAALILSVVAVVRSFGRKRGLAAYDDYGYDDYDFTLDEMGDLTDLYIDDEEDLKF